MKQLSSTVFYIFSLFLVVQGRRVQTSNLPQRLTVEDAADGSDVAFLTRKSIDFKVDDEEDIDVVDADDFLSIRRDNVLLNSATVQSINPYQGARSTDRSMEKAPSYSSLNVASRAQQVGRADSFLPALHKRTNPDSPRISPSWGSVQGLRTESEDSSHSREMAGRISQDSSLSTSLGHIPARGIHQAFMRRFDEQTQLVQESSPSMRSGETQQVNGRPLTGLYQPPVSTPPESSRSMSSGYGQTGQLQQHNDGGPPGFHHIPVPTHRSDLNPQARTFSPQRRLGLTDTAYSGSPQNTGEVFSMEPLSQSLNQVVSPFSTHSPPDTSPRTLQSLQSPVVDRPESRFFPDAPRPRMWSYSGRHQSRFFPETPPSQTQPGRSPEGRSPFLPSPAQRERTQPPIAISMPWREQRPELFPPSLPLTLSPSPSPPRARQQQLEHVSPEDAGRVRGESPRTQQNSSPTSAARLSRPDSTRRRSTSSPPGFERRRTTYVPPARRRLQPSEPIPIRPSSSPRPITYPSAGSSSIGGVHRHPSPSPRQFSPERMPYHSPQRAIYHQQAPYHFPPQSPPGPMPFHMDGPLLMPPPPAQGPLYYYPGPPPPGPPFYASPSVGRPPHLMPSSPNQGFRIPPPSSNMPLPRPPPWPPSPPRQTVIVTPARNAQSRGRNRGGSPK